MVKLIVLMTLALFAGSIAAKECACAEKEKASAHKKAKPKKRPALQEIAPKVEEPKKAPEPIELKKEEPKKSLSLFFTPEETSANKYQSKFLQQEEAPRFQQAEARSSCGFWCKTAWFVGGAIVVGAIMKSRQHDEPVATVTSSTTTTSNTTTTNTTSANTGGGPVNPAP